MLFFLKLLVMVISEGILFVKLGQEFPIFSLQMIACCFVEPLPLIVPKFRTSWLGMKRPRVNKLIMIKLRLSLVGIPPRKFRKS